MHTNRFMAVVAVTGLLTSMVSGDTVMGEFAGETVHVFSDSAWLFHEPHITIQPALLLEIGTELSLIDQLDSVQCSGGLTTPWVQVSLETPSGVVLGFLPGRYLALTSFEMGTDSIFMFGITDFDDESSDFLGSGKLVSGGTVIAVCPYEPVSVGMETGSYHYSVSSLPADPSGLRGVLHIAMVSFDYPACGFPSVTVPFLWTGSELAAGPEAVSMSEAGIFHYNAQILLPSDQGGVDEALVLTGISERWDDESDGYVEERRTVRLFTWDEGGFTEVTAGQD